jgi:phage gp29-like protein
MWNPFRRAHKDTPAAPPPALQTPVLAELVPPGPLPSRPPRRRVISAVQQPQGEWMSYHPGRGLTAQTIRVAFDKAEVGWPQAQCDIFDDVLERDASLRSLVDSRLQSVAGKNWIVQAGGDDDADVEAAKSLERALRRIPHIHTNWEHLLSAVFYGYAACEIEWDIGEDGAIVPVWLANVPHRRIRFDQETDEPRLITRSNWQDGAPLERGKWIWASMRHRRTARGGLLRSAVWWSWLKSLSVRDWQIFSARFGIPFIVATHDPNADEETIKILKEAVVAFGKHGGAVFPNEGEITIKEPGTGSSNVVHPALVELCNREMAKLISGATLTQGEGTSAGSYALGRVHENQSFNFTLGDAERLGSWFTVDLGQAFCEFNGLKARPPKLKVRVVREADPLVRMQIADLFVNKLGGELDEDQIRDEFDFKRPTGPKLVRAPIAAPGADPPGGAPDAAPPTVHSAD